mgnify:CR=1 FL=1
MTPNSIGFLGGTGEEGRGIALRLASGGQETLIGSRSYDSARKAVNWINEQAGQEVATAATNIEVVENCEVLFLTVPFRFASAVIEEARDSFREGQVVVDVTVPLSFEKGPHLLSLEEGSGGEYIRSLLPTNVGLAAAFKTLPAHLLVDIDKPLDCDEFVCGDSSETIEKVMQIVGEIPELRWINAGPLSSCLSLEAMTLLAIRLNRKYKSRLGRYRFLGI